MDGRQIDALDVDGVALSKSPSLTSSAGWLRVHPAGIVDHPHTAVTLDGGDSSALTSSDLVTSAAKNDAVP
jgi:hypothetical protein